ncbi:MAG: sigma-70 family RNA polymerase sigma factor [Dinghuibacter sp.]|nr:sigma-70 family RNA polymerase sigma factor [Dinghuibacter sp.]
MQAVPNIAQQTDEQLMTHAAAGHETAFAELYRRHAQKLFGFFYKMLWGNKTLAEDGVQEVFLKLIRYKNNYDSSRNFSTWLYTIAYNICKNEYRKYEMNHKADLTPVREHTGAGEEQVDLKRFAGAVKKELNGLDEEKKTLFLLRFEEQLSVPEISRIMDIPEGTVKSRIYYLLKHLSEQLKTYQFIHYDNA